jgi:hypothetical protein
MVALIAVIVAAALALFSLLRSHHQETAKSAVIRLSASNAAERLAFLSQFGWEVSEDPIEVSEVIIPAEFDETYEKYNGVQKEQDMDLKPFAGSRVKRWTYEVLNYPGYENQPGVVQANLLVSDGKVVGGDVCSLELGGFLHGFDFPTDKVPATTVVADTQATTAAAES